MKKIDSPYSSMKLLLLIKKRLIKRKKDLKGEAVKKEKQSK